MVSLSRTTRQPGVSHLDEFLSLLFENRMTEAVVSRRCNSLGEITTTIQLSRINEFLSESV